MCLLYLVNGEGRASVRIRVAVIIITTNHPGYAVFCAVDGALTEHP